MGKCLAYAAAVEVHNPAMLATGEDDPSAEGVAALAVNQAGVE
jgi:uncharacterized protein with PIN domain